MDYPDKVEKERRSLREALVRELEISGFAADTIVTRIEELVNAKLWAAHTQGVRQKVDLG